MDLYRVYAAYSDNEELFSISKYSYPDRIGDTKTVTKTAPQKLGTLLIELLNANFTPESYEAILVRFLGNTDAAQYLETAHFEEITYEKSIKQLQKYIDFHSSQNLQYKLDLFHFLVYNRYFCDKDIVLTTVEEEAYDKPLWDEDTDSLVDDIAMIYSFWEEKHFEDRRTYRICDMFLMNIAFSSMQELIRYGKSVKKCRNCGKYFLPSSRSDEIYCDNPSPQEEKLTCKEYGTRRLWYEKQRNNELATLAKNIASAKGMLAKRNPDIPEYVISYEYFKAQRLIWQKAVSRQEKTENEYRSWLLEMRDQKIIKEALPDGHH